MTASLVEYFMCSADDVIDFVICSELGWVWLPAWCVLRARTSFAYTFREIWASLRLINVVRFPINEREKNGTETETLIEINRIAKRKLCQSQK